MMTGTTSAIQKEVFNWPCNGAAIFLEVTATYGVWNAVFEPYIQPPNFDASSVYVEGSTV